MPIQAGQSIPDATVQTMTEDGPSNTTTAELFGGKRTMLFAVPGAFTPGCSMSHLPGFIANTDAILDKGIDQIVCMAVNDAFVMHAWGEAQGAGPIVMVADGNGDFTRALDLEMDGTGFGMGMRSQRFAMIINDGTVEHINVEPGPGINVSDANTMLDLL